MRALTLLLFLIASPAAASDVCHDLWFTRNLIMDRAGYCFGSMLGKATFDNSDCTGKNVSLQAGDQLMVSSIRRREKLLKCGVNTARPLLDLPDVDIRRRLVDLPLRDEFESACIGWLLDDLPLRASAEDGSTIVGVVTHGDNVSFRHDAKGDWNYVTVSGEGWTHKSAGWTNAAFGPQDCRQFAG